MPRINQCFTAPRTIKCFNFTTGEKIGEFSNFSDVKKQFPVSITQLQAVLSRDFFTRTAGKIGKDNLTWRYNYDEDYKVKYKYASCDEYGNIIKKYKTSVEAARDAHTTKSLVVRCCKGRRNVTGYYTDNTKRLRWKYLD
ncbi:MAG: hypothetical protein Nk1A_8670 [Endomicrobiia bacterium]|nr:MAG: hypothetical protein Nk1A_8670 [Endomicrobiia bacterium]